MHRHFQPIWQSNRLLQAPGKAWGYEEGSWRSRCCLVVAILRSAATAYGILWQCRLQNDHPEVLIGMLCGTGGDQVQPRPGLHATYLHAFLCCSDAWTKPKKKEHSYHNDQRGGMECRVLRCLPVLFYDLSKTDGKSPYGQLCKSPRSPFLGWWAIHWSHCLQVVDTMGQIPKFLLPGHWQIYGPLFAFLDDLGVSNYIADLVTFSQLICRT